MPDLLVGPLLRYVDSTSATVWVEVSERCTVGVLGSEARTFEVEGHHFALVTIEGLEPGASVDYTVELDGVRAWPPHDLRVPLSRITTTGPTTPFRMAFGSCRVAAPHEAPFDSTSRREARGRGIDALNSLALALQREAPETWPSVLLLLGDQVYADDVSPATAEFIRERRGPDSEPRDQVADFEEYARLYRESWTDPAIRWLLSSIPSAMIFDDHDIHDDWNTSRAWREEMWAKPWWRERIVGGLMSYWIYQHIGNLSPAELAKDAIFQALDYEADNGPALRQFALDADLEPQSVRWSYRRDWGRVRLIAIDSRASRVVTPDTRDMLDEAEWRWLEAEATAGVDHLLLATSLPFLLPPAIHNVEAWNEAICGGAWGKAGRWAGERMRQAVDLEHWAAFQGSFHRLAALVQRVSLGEPGHAPPATIIALSGDIHFAYVAEASFPGVETETKVYQAVCSPLRNNVERRVLLLNRFAASRAGQWIGRRLARATGIEPALEWEVTDGPWFGNELATLTFTGRTAEFAIQKPLVSDGSRPLKTVGRRTLAGNGAAKA